jgi:hypothetical protein
MRETTAARATCKGLQLLIGSKWEQQPQAIMGTDKTVLGEGGPLSERQVE